MVVHIPLDRSFKSKLLQGKMSKKQYDKNFIYKNIFPMRIRYLVVNCGYTSRIDDKKTIDKLLVEFNEYRELGIKIISIEDIIFNNSSYNFLDIDPECKIYKTPRQNYKTLYNISNVIFTYVKNGKKIHDKIKRHIQLGEDRNCDLIIEFDKKNGNLNYCLNIIQELILLCHCGCFGIDVMTKMYQLTIDGDNVLVMEFDTESG